MKHFRFLLPLAALLLVALASGCGSHSKSAAATATGASSSSDQAATVQYDYTATDDCLSSQYSTEEGSNTISVSQVPDSTDGSSTASAEIYFYSDHAAALKDATPADQVYGNITVSGSAVETPTGKQNILNCLKTASG